MMTVDNYWRGIRQDNRNVLLTGFGQLGRIHYLFPQGNGPRGAYSTFAELAQNLNSRDTIIIGGVLREQAVAPLDVYDVTIIGASNTPRQSTSGGVATGGGATWMAPASGAVALTPLLELRAQGWNISNIEFTPHTGSAAIRFTRSASVDTIDSSHAVIENCLFEANGGTDQIGIEDNGGVRSVTIRNCRFRSLTGTAILGISSSAGVASDWYIGYNRFNNNTHAIAVSLTESRVEWNEIRQAANDTNNKVNLVVLSGQGSLNQVLHNIFPDAAANVTIAKGYKPGTTDLWRNWVSDTAAYIVTVPS